MQIDLDEKEAKTLLQCLRNSFYELKKENKELIEWEEHKKMKADKPQGFCCCIVDETDTIGHIKSKCAVEEDYYKELRDKLKKFQMMFPCEEHSIYRQYGYDKKIGYEGAKWAEVLESGGLPSES